MQTTLNLVEIILNTQNTFKARLHEQIKQRLFEQIRPELLHTDREFEQLKEVLFAHVNGPYEGLQQFYKFGTKNLDMSGLKFASEAV